MPSFFVPAAGDLTAQESPPPPGISIQGKKNSNARVSMSRGRPGCVCVCGGGGGGGAQLELADTKTSQMYSITVLCKTLSFCQLVILCFSEGFSPTKWISSNSLEIEVGSSNNDIASLLSSLFLIVD